MELFLLVFVRSIIRYVVPGIVAVTMARFVGETIGVPLDPIQSLDVGAVLILGAIAGYSLDAVGAYRFTLSIREYRRTRADLHLKLPALPGEASEDPDIRLATLWLRMPDTYDRVILERAEWVLVLEIAAVLLAGALVEAGYVVWLARVENQFRVDLATVSIGLAVASWLASSKGVQRIWAYNKKVEVAAAMATRLDVQTEAERSRQPRDEKGWIERLIEAMIQ